MEAGVVMFIWFLKALWSDFLALTVSILPPEGVNIHTSQQRDVEWPKTTVERMGCISVERFFSYRLLCYLGSAEGLCFQLKFTRACKPRAEDSPGCSPPRPVFLFHFPCEMLFLGGLVSAAPHLVLANLMCTTRYISGKPEPPPLFCLSHTMRTVTLLCWSTMRYHTALSCHIFFLFELWKEVI